MKIAVGGDHAGYHMKEAVKELLRARGHEVVDFGCEGEWSVDYVPYAEEVARAVARGDFERGVLVCGTGLGVSITANKVPGVRAALCCDTYTADLSRRHNDANVLALGGRVIGEGLMEKILDVFMNTHFEGGRHARRLGLIEDLEERVAQGH